MAEDMRERNREFSSTHRQSNYEPLTTRYGMAGNAPFSLLEPHVTHGTPKGTQVGVRACNGCGSPFRPKRSWQKQCSARCRQRTYLRRQPTKTVSYYGA